MNRGLMASYGRIDLVYIYIASGNALSVSTNP